MSFEWERVVVDRRDSPTRTHEGLLAFPIYLHVPGIGSSYGFGFGASNAFGTRMNLLGAATGGNTSLAALGLTEVHLFPGSFFFNFYLFSTRVPFQQFERGSRSLSDEYVSLMRKEYGGTIEANVIAWERRLQWSTMVAPSRLQVASATSPEGSKFVNSDQNEVQTVGTTIRLALDLTDEDLDPRKGVKFQLVGHDSTIFDADHSRYVSLSGFATAFFPVGSSSAWAFNVFRSTSQVWSKSTKSAEELREILGLNCSGIGDPEVKARCQVAEDRRVRERLSANEHGTAALLGGPTQLRGFPVGRFRGSDALMYATEFRWNLTDEDTPFDFGFIRGRRSILQVAPFFEVGTVVDPPETVEQGVMHSAGGVGFRMGFSGVLIRADVGLSNEGPQFTFFFGYPWDLSIL